MRYNTVSSISGIVVILAIFSSLPGAASAQPTPDHPTGNPQTETTQEPAQEPVRGPVRPRRPNPLRDAGFNEKSGPDLIRALAHPDSNVVLAALDAIQIRRETSAISPLRRMLREMPPSETSPSAVGWMSGSTLRVNQVSPLRLCTALAVLGDELAVWAPVAVKLLETSPVDAVGAANLLVQFRNPPDTRGWDIVRSHLFGHDSQMFILAAIAAPYFHGLAMRDLNAAGNTKSPTEAKELSSKIDVVATFLQVIERLELKGKDAIPLQLAKLATPEHLPDLRRVVALLDADELEHKRKYQQILEENEAIGRRQDLAPEEAQRLMQENTLHFRQATAMRGSRDFFRQRLVKLIIQLEAQPQAGEKTQAK